MQCVVSENIHTPPSLPTKGNGNSKGRGSLKEGNFRGGGGGGLLKEFLLPGCLSKIAELFNN